MLAGNHVRFLSKYLTNRIMISRTSSWILRIDPKNNSLLQPKLKDQSKLNRKVHALKEQIFNNKEATYEKLLTKFYCDRKIEFILQTLMLMLLMIKYGLREHWLHINLLKDLENYSQ